MTIVVAPQAGKDLREAYEYILKDNPIAADRVLAHIVEVIGMLASEAITGREVLLRDGRWVKTWPVPPYRIYYRVIGQELQVIRVYHQARRPIER
ncbi:MAG TPA: type II toxin-antitoxin system RelE/ParE family toxin [Nitrospiraceae bacterium]|nr:type II toxin-antitoxin system RelE/ParE family toxin [Nitrospiraceae bacterium]